MIVFIGSGVTNKLINNLPFELHIPGYQFCGPGTKLQRRLEKGQTGINPLDSACRKHDIAYSKNRENVEERNIADTNLAEEAWQRVIAKDSTFGEKAAALAITNIMKTKSKLGMGIRRRNKLSKKTKTKNLTRFPFRRVVNAAKKSMVKKTKNSRTVMKTALAGARKMVKKCGGKRKIKVPKILPIPLKVGGALPLIPIFAGLSALGAITSGISGIAKAVNDSNSAKEQLNEAVRHNQMMESISLGKGLYLRPYKAGSGVKLRLHTEDLKKKNP